MRIDVNFTLGGGGEDDGNGNGPGDEYVFDGRVTVDLDDDGDDVPNALDGCPQDPAKDDAGQCGCGQPDDDADTDEVADCIDNCPTVVNGDQADGNGDGVGDACDPAFQDEDGDGVPDADDECAGTPAGEPVEPGVGCSIDQLCPCNAPRGGSRWRNHGAYVSCVARSGESFEEQGLVSAEEKDAIVSAAGRSQCGKGGSSAAASPADPLGLGALLTAVQGLFQP